MVDTISVTVVILGAIGFLVALWGALVADIDLSYRYGDDDHIEEDDYWD